MQVKPQTTIYHTYFGYDFFSYLKMGAGCGGRGLILEYNTDLSAICQVATITLQTLQS